MAHNLKFNKQYKVGFGLIQNILCGPTDFIEGQGNRVQENVQSRNGILLPKLFLLTVRRNCSSDQEKILKFEAECQEFAKILRSLEQFVQTVKGQNNFL